jgi:3-hydroxyisobutyrate dehydrogenase
MLRNTANATRLICLQRFNAWKGDVRWSSSSSSQVIGFLGLGNMGLPMAMNLSKTKEVIAFDLNEKARESAEMGGVPIADSISAVASQSSTIITMLPGDDAVHAVMNIIIEELSSHESLTTIVDCSTVSPATSRHWQEQLVATGRDFVDAPVSGGVKGAQNASLTFMVGTASMTNLEQTVRPLLECMGQKVISCGGPGAGAATKLCNNLALAAQMVGICEAMNLGDALGVDPVVLAKVLNTSTAKSWSCEVNNPHPNVAAVTGAPASRDYQGGFASKLMLKDLSLAVHAGKEAKVALPMGNATKELYQMAILRGLGEKDFGVILQFLRGK